MRDFIHIDDCVRGVIATMDRIDDGSAVNLSTGMFTSFKQFAARLLKLPDMSRRLSGCQPSPKGCSPEPATPASRGNGIRLPELSKTESDGPGTFRPSMKPAVIQLA